MPAPQPRPSASNPTGRRRRLTLLIAALGCAAAGWQCALRKINLVSESQEIQIGRSMAQQIETQMKILDQPEVQNYVEDLGQHLVRHSGRSDLAYRFRVIDGDPVNAFSLPGGFVYVYTGLMRAAETEAELAGVLAHEIAHVTEKHAVKRYSSIQLFGLGARVGGGAVGGLGGSALYSGLQLGGLFAILGYSRADEHEADRVGLAMLDRSGYQPESMIDFMGTLIAVRREEEAKDPDRDAVPALLRTHPATEDRIEALEQELARLQSAPPAVEPPAADASKPAPERFEEVQRIVQLVYEERQRKGLEVPALDKEGRPSDPEREPAGP
ncbi:MAG TPA: M48 family metallopeptidase [Acidobacteriota bacterium]